MSRKALLRSRPLGGFLRVEIHLVQGEGTHTKLASRHKCLEQGTVSSDDPCSPETGYSSDKVEQWPVGKPSADVGLLCVARARMRAHEQCLSPTVSAHH